MMCDGTPRKLSICKLTENGEVYKSALQEHKPFNAQQNCFVLEEYNRCTP